MNEQSNGGYIRLFRKLLENPIWTQLAPAVTKIAIYFLLHANYKPRQWYDGASTVEIPAGSLVTSLTSTAASCNLSVQQVRDAFDHLSRTQFATFRKTHRWTLVTVLNLASYQASPDDENTQKNTANGNVETGQRTLNKKKISKKHLPPKEAVNEIPTDPDELPFVTVLSPLPTEELNGKNGHSAAVPQNGNGRASKIREAIAGIAARIHARHPTAFDRRDLSAAAVERKLAAILNHRKIPVNEQEAYLEQIDRNHAAMCASEGWRKEGGQYVKGLEKWLAPTMDRYLVAPESAPAPVNNFPRVIL